MRNILLASAAAPALLYALPSQAQTCTAAPSCTTLGYTKTASQCSGKSYTRCPFDTSKYACDSATSSTECYNLGFIDSKKNCAGDYIACPGNDTYVRCLTGAKVGDLKYSLRTEDHDGWLLCNGGDYDEKEYPELYAVIGDTFGTKRPNYNGFFLKGVATETVADFAKGQLDSLPNIKGSIMMLGPNRASSYGTGAFTVKDSGMKWGDGSGSGTKSAGFDFDASRSSSVYKGTIQNIDGQGNKTTSMVNVNKVIPANYPANIFIYAGRKMSGQTTCEQSGYLNSEPKGYYCTEKTVGSTKCYTSCKPKTVLEQCQEKYPGEACSSYDITKCYANSEGWCYRAEYDDCGESMTTYGSSPSAIEDEICLPYAGQLIKSCFLDEYCMSVDYGIRI